MRRKIIYDPTRDYYSILGIETNASLEQIRLAYRRSVRQVHPDLHPDQADWATQQIQLINEAYGVLRNPAQRREYDGQRWPHLRSKPEVARPFTMPEYDSSRPWWQQYVPRRYSFEDSVPDVSWLHSHHLGLIEPTWITLVGIWRSPYAGLLSVLSVLLALNVAVLIYVAITPQDFDALLQLSGKTLTPYQSPVFSTPIPDQLYPECNASGVQIIAPDNYEMVGDTFTITGTVDHPDLAYYVIQMGYMLDRTTAPSVWRILRLSFPAEAGLLTEEIPMSGRSPGYYAVRVRVVLQDQTELQPCDVMIQH
jgi:hypothetical protein